MLGSIFILQAGQVLGRTLFFLFSVWYLNRYLGVEAKGAWTGIFALFGILSVCSNMGFEVWLSRAAATSTVSSGQAIRFLFRTKGVLWLVCLGVGALFSIGKGQAGLAVPFAFALVFDGIGVAEQAVFEGKRATWAMASMSFLKSGGFAVLALTAGFLVEEPRLPVFAWLFALVLLVRVALGWRCWALLPRGGERLRPDAWREFLLMGAYTLVTVLYFKIDAVMLSQMAGPTVTGNYGNAYDMVEGALFISAAVGSVLYPRLVTARGKERAHLFDNLFQLILVVGVTGTSAIWLLGEPVGRFLAGNDFAGAVRPLIILAPGLPFMFGNGLLSRWLFSTGREGFALKTAAFLAVFNIAGNWIVIPRYGAEGASAMTLATEGALFVFWILRGRKAPLLLGFWLALTAPLALTAYTLFGLARPALALAVSVAAFFPLLVMFVRRVHRFKVTGDPPHHEPRSEKE